MVLAITIRLRATGKGGGGRTMKKIHHTGEASKSKLDNAAIHQALNRIMKAAEEIDREVDEILAIARSRPVSNRRYDSGTDSLRAPHFSQNVTESAGLRSGRPQRPLG